MDFFENLINKKKQPKQTDLIQNLYKVPKRDPRGVRPTFLDPKPGVVNQADLLFLPTDNGYKYALVVVDDNSKICDAVPLKEKTADAVKKGLKTIYSRSILSKPLLMEVDPGAEFKGVTRQYFDDNDIAVRVGKPGRHRQQGIVERRNQLIGTALLKRQAAEELKTGQPATKWTKDLPLLVAALNKKANSNLQIRAKFLKKHPLPMKPLFEKSNATILPIGTRVRVQLEYPIDVATGKKLFGRFRSGDIRWDPKERMIEKILIRPNQPVQYMLDGPERVAYTQYQLQVIPKNETPPPNSVVQSKPTEYAVEKILDQKKVGKVVWLKVKWRGYGLSESTWQKRSILLEDVPDLVREYEQKK